VNLIVVQRISLQDAADHLASTRYIARANANERAVFDFDPHAIEKSVPNFCSFQSVANCPVQPGWPAFCYEFAKGLVRHLPKSGPPQNDRLHFDQRFGFHLGGIIMLASEPRKRLRRGTTDPHMTQLLAARDVLPTHFVILSEHVAPVAIKT
jgi:hypothetical protein